MDLYLRKGADRRLRAGHLWVYSNEVDGKLNPLSGFQAGDVVWVRSCDGSLLGSAYMEPHSLICARIFAPREQRAPDEEFLVGAITRALNGRQAAFDQPCYRLIYGDSDGLPGLVVDRFFDYLVVQLNNAGVERWQDDLIAALVVVLAPLGILIRADSRSRREQGLADRVEVVYGNVPQRVELQENGVRFLAPVHTGQKTGWFYDHRMSRGRLAAYAAGARVLDVYSYIGGWGIQAAAFGSREVVCLDSSEQALQGVEENARLNGLQDKVSIRHGPAAETMAAMCREDARFELVILDPPAFIQRRRDLKKGIAAYRRINELGLRLLRPGGVLVSASCSMHLTRADLMQAMQGAAARAGSELRIIEQGGQGPDHPIHPAIPETEYLKAMFARRW
jgi:23S rRNA (cytosine1962-C5)-methyltransferase